MSKDKIIQFPGAMIPDKTAEKAIEHVINASIEQRTAIINDFGKAYLAETGLLPSEVVLNQQNFNDEKGPRIEWWFRRKGEAQKALDTDAQVGELRASRQAFEAKIDSLFTYASYENTREFRDAALWAYELLVNGIDTSKK